LTRHRKGGVLGDRKIGAAKLEQDLKTKKRTKKELNYMLQAEGSTNDWKKNQEG